MTGMRMRSSREGVCGIMQYSFSLVTAVVLTQSLEKMVALLLSPAICEIPVWPDDGVGKSLKAEQMCTTKTVVVDRPW